VTSSPPPGVRLRRAEPADAPGVADLLITSRAAADIPPAVHDDADVHRWVATHLLQECDVWLAVVDGAAPIGVLALAPGWVEQLFVTPAWFGRGIGSLLLDRAKQLQPDGLQLWVFESNVGAQRFYERHGFVAVEHTDGSGNEEQAPDVRYRWDPSGDGTAV
jgi:GNAT superfamily N-acetyltransferase